MPINNKPIAVYDFETTGKDPNTCSPIEFACQVYNPRTLEPYPHGQFHSGMKLTDDSTVDPDTLAWHCNLRKKTPKEMMDLWHSNPDRKDVWRDFAVFLRQFNSSKNNSNFDAPIPGGYNINGFDSVLIDRLCKETGLLAKNGKQNLFNQLFYIDLMQDMWAWTENSDCITNLKFDTVRTFLGMTHNESHTALADVLQEGAVIMRFQKFKRRLFKPEKFAGAFSDE